MNIRDLSVEPREALGKGAVGRLRRKGLVPAILYGGGSAPVTLAVAPTDVRRALHGHGAGGVLVNIRLPGDAEPRTAVVRELQYDPVRDTLIHIDFQAVRMDEEITVEVPIHVVGEAAGVKDQNGVLALLLRAVEVSCLPSLIPERIDIDVSALRIHDVATVADLAAARGRPRDGAQHATRRHRGPADGRGSRGCRRRAGGRARGRHRAQAQGREEEAKGKDGKEEGKAKK